MVVVVAVGGACGDNGNVTDTTGPEMTSDLTTGTPTTLASTSMAETETSPTTEAPTTTATSTTSADSTSSAGTSTGDSTGEPVDPCADSVVTWENFAQGFMLSWCTGCHHSALPVMQRAAAPCTVNFDVHSSTAKFAPLIGLRVLDYEVHDVPPMPPAVVIPSDQLELLREWIDCGAKGPEAPDLPVVCCPDPSPQDNCS